LPNPLAASPSQPTESFLDDLANALQRTVYAIYQSALPESLVDVLWLECNQLPDTEFKKAGVGRQDEFQLNRDIRRDKIHWLDGETPSQQAFMAWMEGLRLGLNQRLFLGLFDYECHFARYGEGAFYKKHLDAFKTPEESHLPKRLLSSVLYLNRDWGNEDGGELLLYPPQDENTPEDIQPLAVVAPLYGRLVVFLSDEFPHEVALARRERQSIAGWFRSQGLAVAQVV